MSKRVVITGMGLVSALGNDLDTAFNRLHEYKNAVCEMENLSAIRGLNSHLAAPVDFTTPEHFTRKVLRTMGPVSVMAVYSAENALRDAGLLGSDEITNGRTGVAYGSSFGSAGPVADFFSMVKTNEIGDVTSSSYIKIMPQTTAVNISLYFKTTGRLIPSGTACTSGSLSLGYAYENIKSGLKLQLYKIILSSIIFKIIFVLTSFLGYPFALNIRERFLQSRRYIDGLDLKFKGSIGRICGIWYLGLVLSIFTLTLYIPYLFFKLNKYIITNTVLKDEGCLN